MLPPSVPTDPVPAAVDPRWHRIASRDEAHDIVGRALCMGRQRRLVVHGRYIGVITHHMLACGYLFLRRIEATGSFMSELTPTPTEPSDCPNLAAYRMPQRRHFIDVAAFAIEVIGRADRDMAWSGAFQLGSELPGYGNDVLWCAGTQPAGPWRISELWAAEEAAREAERKKYPSWDDW